MTSTPLMQTKIVSGQTPSMSCSYDSLVLGFRQGLLWERRRDRADSHTTPAYKALLGHRLDHNTRPQSDRRPVIS